MNLEKILPVNKESLSTEIVYNVQNFCVQLHFKKNKVFYVDISYTVFNILYTG